MDDDAELINDLQREVDRYASADNDQQDEWATSARLAIGRLREPIVADDDRRAARALLERIRGRLT